MNVKRQPKRQKYQLHHLSRLSILLPWPYCALPSHNPAPGSNHSSEMLKIIYRHSFYLSKPVCGEHKMTDRENEDREMLSSQRHLPSHPLNPWRGCLVLDPRCAFQMITFSLQGDTLLSSCELCSAHSIPAKNFLRFSILSPIVRNTRAIQSVQEILGEAPLCPAWSHRDDRPCNSLGRWSRPLLALGEPAAGLF